MVDVCPLFIAPNSWYRDLIHYLQEGYFSEHWNPKQRRALHIKSSLYQIIDGVMFRKNYDGVFLRCLEHEDAKKVVTELHDGTVGVLHRNIALLIHVSTLCLIPKFLSAKVD